MGEESRKSEMFKVVGKEVHQPRICIQISIQKGGKNKGILRQKQD
jgi:hypothetical protein